VFANFRTTFVCLDIIEQQLPDGDVCLVRQVLQHLSNAEIKAILDKLNKYKYVFVTEHYPLGNDCLPNIDKPHGADIRLYDNSAVFLDKEPFNISHIELVLNVPYDNWGTVRTYLIENS
jgi:hypothetical protein